VRPLTILYVGAGIAAAAAGGVIAWRVWQRGEDVAEAAQEVLQAVNPTNPDNVAARAVNTVVQKITGDDQATLGTKLWEWMNPGQAAADNRITDPVRVKEPAPGSGQGAAPDFGDFASSSPIWDDESRGLGRVYSDVAPLDLPTTPFWYGAP
jgi:hypothetical protein